MTCLFTSKIQASFAVPRRLRRNNDWRRTMATVGNRRRQKVPRRQRQTATGGDRRRPAATGGSRQRPEATDGGRKCRGVRRYGGTMVIGSDRRRRRRVRWFFSIAPSTTPLKKWLSEWVTTAISRKDLYLKSPSLRHDRVYAVVMFTYSMYLLII